MGLNSMLGGIIGGWGGYGAAFTPGQGFMLVLISGLVFMLLSVIRIKGKTVRELVFDGMPVAVRSSISVGIGGIYNRISAVLRLLLRTRGIVRYIKDKRGRHAGTSFSLL